MPEIDTSGWGRQLREDLTAETKATTQALADEIARALHKHPIWPRRSGRSARGFYTAVEGDTVRVLNHWPHAAAVNNRRSYRGGRRNPNYGAVQRIIESSWNRILAAAVKRLDRGSP